MRELQESALFIFTVCTSDFLSFRFFSHKIQDLLMNDHEEIPYFKD